VNQADHYFQTFDDLANRVNKIKVDGYRHHLVKNRGREQKDKIGRLKKMSSTIVSAGEGGVAAKLGFGVLLGLGHLALAFTVPLGIPFIAIQATAIIFAVTIFIGGTLSNNFLIANGFDKTLSFIAKKGHDYDLETGDKRPRLTSYLARLTISSTIVAAITMGCLSFSSNTALISGSVGAVASALGFSFPPVGAAIAGTIVAGFTSVVIFCIFFEGYVDIINRDRWQAFKNYVRERFSVTDKLQAKTEHLRSCGLTWQIVGIHVTNLAKFMLVDIPITGITYGLAVLGAVVNHYLLRQSGKSTLDGITDKLALAESVKNQIMHVGSQIFNVLGPITGYMGISIFYQNGIGNFLNSVKERPGDFAKDLCITVGLMPFAPLIYAGLMGYGVLRVAADPIVQLYRGSKHTLSKLAPYNADHNNTAENPNKDPAIQFQKANRQYAHQYKKSEPYKFKLLETSTNWNTFGQLGAAQDPKVAANLQNHHVPSPAATIAQATGSHGNNAVSVESNKQNFPKDCQQKLSHALSTYNWLQNQPVKIAQDKEIEKLISNAPAY